MTKNYKSQDLTGTDFTGVDLTGATLAHATLTGCKFGKCAGANFVCTKGTNIDFVNADITGSTFEKADDSVLPCLVGSLWNGATITGVSPWLVKEDATFWSFCTNAFVQVGCRQRTLAECLAMSADHSIIPSMHADQPNFDAQKLIDWWEQHGPTIHDWFTKLPMSSSNKSGE